jgi:hypothetical protein
MLEKLSLVSTGGRVNWRRLYEEAMVFMREAGLHIPPSTVVRQLSGLTNNLSKLPSTRQGDAKISHSSCARARSSAFTVSLVRGEALIFDRHSQRVLRRKAFYAPLPNSPGPDLTAVHTFRQPSPHTIRLI